MGKIMINDVPYSGSFDKAGNVSYDNTNSGLSATNVQGAVDELNSNKININESGIHFVNDLILPISNFAGGLPVTKIYMNWHTTDGWCLMVKFLYNDELYTGRIKLTGSSKDN